MRRLVFCLPGAAARGVQVNAVTPAARRWSARLVRTPRAPLPIVIEARTLAAPTDPRRFTARSPRVGTLLMSMNKVRHGCSELRRKQRFDVLQVFFAKPG
jgi:hypothetical protein